MLMMVMVWAYFSVSQLLIVWIGDLPHEISFYLPRFATSWGWLGVALIRGAVLRSFSAAALPAVEAECRRPHRCSRGRAGDALHGPGLDRAPRLSQRRISHDLDDLHGAARYRRSLVMAFLWQLPKLPLLPVNAPELAEALAHETE